MSNGNHAHGAMHAWVDDAIAHGHFRDGYFRFAPPPADAAGAAADGLPPTPFTVSREARRELAALLDNRMRLLVHEAGKFARAAKRDARAAGAARVAVVPLATGRGGSARKRPPAVQWVL